MDLLIYETTHHETLPALLDLASAYFDRVTVFLKESSYHHLSALAGPEKKWPGARFVVQPQDQNNRSFIRECVNTLRQKTFSHFHISTLDNNLLYFATRLLMARRVGVSLSVQAVNEYAAHRYSNVRDLTESVAKLYFHRRIRHYRVFFPAMKDHLQKAMPGGIASYIPPRFFSGNRPPGAPGEPFRIVVPGSLDPVRRDYHQVPVFFKKFLGQRRPGRKIELVILGHGKSSYALPILRQLQELQREDFSLVSYQDYVPAAEYESRLATADLIWSPIRLETLGIRDTPEFYGLSTATGLTGDLLMTARPALVPAGFRVPDHYEHTIITYQSESELGDWIIHFLENPDEERMEQIGRELSFFKKENFYRAFEELLDMKK